MEKVTDFTKVKVISIQALHFRYNEKGELKRYSRKNYNGFRPATKGGMTVVAVYVNYEGESEVVMGSSHCSKEDNFNYHEGRVLAVYNALKKVGCTEFLDAEEIDAKMFGRFSEKQAQEWLNAHVKPA